MSNLSHCLQAAGKGEDTQATGTERRLAPLPSPGEQNPTHGQLVPLAFPITHTRNKRNHLHLLPSLKSKRRTDLHHGGRNYQVLTAAAARPPAPAPQRAPRSGSVSTAPHPAPRCRRSPGGRGEPGRRRLPADSGASPHPAAART